MLWSGVFVASAAVGKRAAAALLFSLSAAVLVLEILAARLLAPFVGLSLETYTAIIGVVLAGIASGHAVGGRLADRYPWRSLLGPCVLVGGLLASMTVPVVEVVGASSAQQSIPRVVLLAFAGFFLPTAVLSAASPIVTRAQLHSLDESGRVVGSLSAWSTAGALFGTFVTGFVLVATLPTTRIIWLLATGLVVLGLALTIPRRTVKLLVIVVALGAGGWAGQTSTSPCDEETRYYSCACAQRRTPLGLGFSNWTRSPTAMSISTSRTGSASGISGS